MPVRHVSLGAPEVTSASLSLPSYIRERHSGTWQAYLAYHGNLTFTDDGRYYLRGPQPGGAGDQPSLHHGGRAAPVCKEVQPLVHKDAVVHHRLRVVPPRLDRARGARHPGDRQRLAGPPGRAPAAPHRPRGQWPVSKFV
eukprot:6085025-Pyramimonas_sp.AAC.2